VDAAQRRGLHRVDAHAAQRLALRVHQHARDRQWRSVEAHDHVVDFALRVHACSDPLQHGVARGARRRVQRVVRVDGAGQPQREPAVGPGLRALEDPS
jgi:hypothetical protein